MLKLRPHQVTCANKALSILQKYKLAYLAMETRTGKTITAFQVAKDYGAKTVLFITKKAVIKGAMKDAELFPDLMVSFINHESTDKAFENVPFYTVIIETPEYNEKKDCIVHKKEKLKFKTFDYDLIIIDEAHAYKAFPKPSQRTRFLKGNLLNKTILYLSATPTPESFSELYHQFWLSSFTPFKEKTFYLWAKNFVNVTQKSWLKIPTNRGLVCPNDYSQAKEELIMPIFNKYKVTCTQKEAGFQAEVREDFLFVKMSALTQSYFYTMKNPKKGVIEMDNGVYITAENAGTRMSKLHQLSSGTVLDEHGLTYIIDTNKAEEIERHALSNNYRKFAIYYKFRAELEAIKKVFGERLIFVAQDFEKAETGIFVSQIISGREGIKLASGDALYFYNIDFSYLSYEQTRNRMQDFLRETPSKIIWVFSTLNFERNVYETVKDKQDFTLSHFKEWNNDSTNNPEKN